MATMNAGASETDARAIDVLRRRIGRDERAAQPHDGFMLAADFDSYAQAQRAVGTCRQEQPRWRTSAIRNIANVGGFSSDRTIDVYARDIWNVT